MRFQMIAAIAACVVFLPAARAAADAEPAVSLPRYHLMPGQELTYTSTGEFKYEHGTLKSGSKDVFNVVAANADGGWHVIGRLSSWETQGDAPAQPEMELVAFDLRPDGTATLSPGANARGGVPMEFPALPADPSQYAHNWEEARPFGAHLTFQSRPSTQPGLVEFTADQLDPMYRIYEITRQTTYQFDPARGILVGSSSRTSQGYGFVGKGTDNLTLTTSADKSGKWLEELARDCDVYLTTKAKCSDILKKAAVDPAQSDPAFAAAKELLTTARKQIVSSEIGDLLDKDVADLPDRAKYTKKEAEDLLAVLDKPAADWTLTDASGAKHSLGDYRGKVVVLDFWYRGCGWCMRAMPEMKQLATDFSGKPVAVLGMNTDSKPADAKFVVDAFGLDYPILHVEQELVDRYHVQGFPTVLVIDPAGVVRDVEVGYSPDLREKLAAKITALVPGK